MLNSDQKRAFLAVVLSGVVLFGWQYYFSKSAPSQNISSSASQAKNVTAAGASESKALDDKNSSTASTISKADSVTPIQNNVEKQQFVITHNNYSFKITNTLEVVEMKNPGSVFDFKSLTDSATPLKIQVVPDETPMDLYFQMNQEGSNKLVGFNQNFDVTFEAFIRDNGKVAIQLKSNRNYKFRLVLDAKPKKLDSGQIRNFSIFTNKLKTLEVGSEENSDGGFKWVATDFNFHLFGFIFPKETPSRYKTTEVGQIVIDVPESSKAFSGDIIFTKKNYDDLIALGDNLHLSVDFGWFGVIAVPTLRALQFVYKFIPNYGLAIILVTILIRLITFPLQYKSFVSMKKMQTIQPELTKIKEKYKDEPQKMQKETMELFKKAGANPLSGCFTLLLQMPFFFAIYKVLSSSVELVGAPFFGWIHDLSIQDPYYILPVLMGVAMFLQQKMTPTTSMDPTQAKIMLVMPIVFAFIMKSLPAGLVLYILVSTVFGLIQQKVVYKMVD